MTRTTRIARVTCHGTGASAARSGGRSVVDTCAGRAFHRRRGRRGSRVRPSANRKCAPKRERRHLAGLTNAGVIIMSVVLGAVVVMLVLVLVSHH
jgi:hypothetical protein